MSQKVSDIVARIEDPETPVVWLDPTTADSIWEGVPAALEQAGYAVFRLDGAGAREGLEGLKQRAAAFRPVKGWVVVYREPDEYRQGDEAGFEDFLEGVEGEHERRMAAEGRSFKLLVKD
jgi:hypothetical protein